MEHINTRAIADYMSLNVAKCSVMQCSFRRCVPPPPRITANGQPVPIVNSLTLLGVTLTPTLKWNTHVANLVSKANSKRFFLVVLRRAGVTTQHLITFYVTYIRPTLEYAAPVWHPGLSKDLAAQLERVQHLGLQAIFPLLSYQAALASSGLSRLDDRREKICHTFARRAFNSEFRYWFPENRPPTGHNLRYTRPLRVELQKTLRAANSPINYFIRLLNHDTTFTTNAD